MNQPQSMAPLSRAALAAHWMPYTGSREFKRDPRIIGHTGTV